MKGIVKYSLLAAVICCFTALPVFAGDWQFGLGLNGGFSRLEGDLRGSELSPIVSGHLRALPLPYLALNGELGYSVLGTSSHPSFTNFQTTIIPFELSVLFNFLPLSRFNPYIQAGGGGVFWKATADNVAGNIEDGVDSFLKTEGGIEFRVSPNFGVNLGASYRFSLTDAFDQLRQGDENDQVLDMHAGFTYYFTRHPGDKDHDDVPDELDLMPEIAEDRDGYLDHDGIPEKNPSSLAYSSPDGPVQGDGLSSPVVVHHLITKAESGKNLLVRAVVHSNTSLRVVAALYRPLGTVKWNVVRLEEYQPSQYSGEIPGYAINMEGLEYCVVAVDETLSGVGFSGLPSKPIQVDVFQSGTPWRIVGGVVGAATVGTASYLVLRKQD